MVPSRQTLGLVGVIACGLTLIGATTYFVATRFVRKRRSSRQNAHSKDEQLEEHDYLSDDEDFSLRFSDDRRQRNLQRRASARRPPPLITFAELFEQALLLQQHRNSQRKVRIYFDSNDEFVSEE